MHIWGAESELRTVSNNSNNGAASHAEVTLLVMHRDAGKISTTIECTTARDTNASQISREPIDDPSETPRTSQQ